MKCTKISFRQHLMILC